MVFISLLNSLLTSIYLIIEPIVFSTSLCVCVCVWGGSSGHFVFDRFYFFMHPVTLETFKDFENWSYFVIILINLQIWTLAVVKVHL